MQQVIDSLSVVKPQVAKWAVHEGEVIYAPADTVNWKKEFQPFTSEDVNQLRYKDAFDVTDEMIGQDRIIRFEAKEDDQEIREVHYKIHKGSIVYFKMVKERSNIFSQSFQRFEFNQNQYEFVLEQSIHGVFENNQTVHGDILEDGDLWLGHFQLEADKMPFQMLFRNDTEHELVTKNGTERSAFNTFSKRGDTLVFESDVFRTRFEIEQISESSMSGTWYSNQSDRPRIVPFTAQKGVMNRTGVTTTPSINLSGEHLAVFYTEDGEPEDSTVLSINQTAHNVYASFLTQTGDYRYLEGGIRNDSLFLSTVDGSHVFYFYASVKGNALEGVFRSGNHWKQPWKAFIGTPYTLHNPSDMTKAISDSAVTFSFPASKNELISLEDEQFSNRPVIISITGTWCPNCMDEAAFLQEVRDMFSEDELGIVSLDFELISDSVKAFENIEKHKKTLGLTYPVLLASVKSSKQNASEMLPFVDRIISYPTMVVLNRNHEVVRTHAGFSGPATGTSHYDAFRKEYLELFEHLVAN